MFVVHGLQCFVWFLCVQQLLGAAVNELLENRLIYQNNVTCVISAESFTMNCSWCSPEFPNISYTKWYDIHYVMGDRGGKCSGDCFCFDCFCYNIPMNKADSFKANVSFYFKETLWNTSKTEQFFLTKGLSLDYFMLLLPNVTNVTVKTDNSSMATIAWEPINDRALKSLTEAEIINLLHYEVHITSNSSSKNQPGFSSNCEIVSNNSTEYSCNVGKALSLNITSIEPSTQYTYKVCVVLNKSRSCGDEISWLQPPTPVAPTPMELVGSSLNDIITPSTHGAGSDSPPTLVIIIMGCIAGLVILGFASFTAWRCCSKISNSKIAISLPPKAIDVENTAYETHQDEKLPFNLTYDSTRVTPALPHQCNSTTRSECIDSSDYYRIVLNTDNNICHSEVIRPDESSQIMLLTSGEYCDTQRGRNHEQYTSGSGDTWPMGTGDSNGAFDSNDGSRTTVTSEQALALHSDYSVYRTHEPHTSGESGLIGSSNYCTSNTASIQVQASDPYCVAEKGIRHQPYTEDAGLICSANYIHY